MEPGKVKPAILLLATAAVAAIETAMVVLSGARVVHPYLLLTAGRLMEIGVIWKIAAFDDPEGGSIGLKKGTLLSGFKAGLLWSAAFGLIVALTGAALYFFGTNPLNLVGGRVPADPIKFLLLVTAGGVVSPVAEELFFRGLIYGFLRRWGVIAALTGSTLIFALAHLFGPSINYTQIVGGIVFALAYEFSGSLITPITIHIIGNLALFSIPLLSSLLK